MDTRVTLIQDEALEALRLALSAARPQTADDGFSTTQEWKAALRFGEEKTRNAIKALLQAGKMEKKKVQRFSEMADRDIWTMGFRLK